MERRRAVPVAAVTALGSMVVAAAASFGILGSRGAGTSEPPEPAVSAAGVPATGLGPAPAPQVEVRYEDVIVPVSAATPVPGPAVGASPALPTGGSGAAVTDSPSPVTSVTGPRSVGRSDEDRDDGNGGGHDEDGGDPDGDRNDRDGDGDDRDRDRGERDGDD